jgi:tRNA A-37 threonylcarbamoyl transferase component Bud32
MGVGDLVPPALEQLGATVSLIDTNELAWGDLSKYDVIMTGVRASADFALGSAPRSSRNRTTGT